MSEAIYSDPRLVAVYDFFNPWSDDTEFYLRLAKGPPKRILDIGCGSGLLACAFADLGHRVTGLDPAAEMLKLAARQAGGEKVRWICGDASAVPQGEIFDLIVMTGHAFQNLLDDAQALALFGAARTALGSSGRFAFETRNPASSPWLDWTPELSRREVALPDGGLAECQHALLEVADDLVVFETTYRFVPGGEAMTSRSTLRFPDQQKLAQLLKRAGFDQVEWLGDWRGRPWGVDSAEIIVIAG